MTRHATHLIDKVRRRRTWIIALASLLPVALIASLPHLAAALILHPYRKPLTAAPPTGCQTVQFAGNGVKLHGWFGKAVGTRRGTIIYLHGVADNRISGGGVIQRFRKRGFDVISYDSRAHGESGGTFCTYGFHEKEDLRRVIDTVDPGPVILIGSSLGGAVSLQLAATDSRITTIIAAETFSDFRTVATERAPFFLTRRQIEKAFAIAGTKGEFAIDSVSPVKAAADITIPVLLIHGANDTDTPPDHSRRILAKLQGPRKLIIIPAAAHNQSLGGNVWAEIERWIDAQPGSPGDERIAPMKNDTGPIKSLRQDS
jgi:uncharacterized protein